MRRLSGGLVLVAIVGLGVGLAAQMVYADGGDPSLIHACVKNNGDVRIKGPAGSCHHNETAVHWSIAGPAGPAGATGPTGAAGPAGLTGAVGAVGAAGLSVTSVVDRITGPAGLSVTSVPVGSLTALPAGATTRRVMVVNAVLRSGPVEALPILGVFHAFIAPNPVAGAYAVTVWDPASGTEFTGSGSDVVHLYIASYFSD